MKTEKKVLCEMNGIHSDMLMDIYVKSSKKGETLEIFEEKKMNVLFFCFQERLILRFPIVLMRIVSVKILLKKSLMQFIFQRGSGSCNCL